MQEKYGFVYLWRDRKHKRYYLGCRWGTTEDGYICSSTWMKQAYKHRPQDFKRKILSYVYTNRTDLLEQEYKWLSLIKSEELGKKYYNKHNYHYGHWTSNSEKAISTLEKMSNAAKNKHKDPEFRKKYEEAIRKRNNKSSDPEVREKRRQSMIKTMAKKFPEENRPDFNRVSSGSEEHRIKNSIGGKKAWANRTEQQKQDMQNKIIETKIKNGTLNKGHSIGKFWWNNGTNNKRSKECPGNNWVKGKIHNLSINTTIIL